MREVRVSTIITRRALFEEDMSKVISRAKERIALAGRDKADLVLLSEVFGNNLQKFTAAEVARTAQTVPGPISEELAPLARRYQTYVAFGLLRRSGKSFYNSLVLLDRNGKHVWTYDKVTPTLYEMNGGLVKPGRNFDSYLCDFGRIGGAICFDINFLELAEVYFRQDVELVLFSSVFPAGRLLNVWAIRYGFNVAGSTWYDHNRIIDCAGRTVGETSEVIPRATSVLNLNRRVVHMDKNLEKIEDMQKKYPGDILVEDLRPEAFCVITGLKKGLEVSALIKEFKIITLADYFERSRKVRAEMGGMSYTIKT